VRNLITAAMCGVLILIGQPCTAVVWDVTSSFSIADGNPNGAWTYGWADNAAFQPYEIPSSNANPAWIAWTTASSYAGSWKNNGPANYGVQTGQVSLQPGSSYEASVARWTAPAGIVSPVQVQGQFYPGDIGGMQVGVFKNTTFVSGIPQVGPSDWHASNLGTFDLSLDVSTGDIIEFAVYGGYMFGNTPLEATITAVPEPSALALLGIGVTSLVAYVWSWKRRAAQHGGGV
jgi:hypothetical protein